MSFSPRVFSLNMFKLKTMGPKFMYTVKTTIFGMIVILEMNGKKHIHG